MNDPKLNKKGINFYLSLEKYMQKLTHFTYITSLALALISTPLSEKTKRKILRDIKKEFKKLEKK